MKQKKGNMLLTIILVAILSVIIWFVSSCAAPTRDIPSGTYRIQIVYQNGDKSEKNVQGPISLSHDCVWEQSTQSYLACGVREYTIIK